MRYKKYFKMWCDLKQIISNTYLAANYKDNKITYDWILELMKVLEERK